MTTSRAQIEIRLAEFAEAIDHGEGIEVFDEGTVLLDLQSGEVGSTLSLTPEIAVILGRQLILAGTIGARTQKKARKGRGNG